MTCGRCRAEHEENEQSDMVPCDESGEPCAQMLVELAPENELAFDLYHIARIEGIGALALDLELRTRDLTMTKTEAWELLQKFYIISSTVADIDREEGEKAKDHGRGPATIT